MRSYSYNVISDEKVPKICVFSCFSIDFTEEDVKAFDCERCHHPHPRGCSERRRRFGLNPKAYRTIKLLIYFNFHELELPASML